MVIVLQLKEKTWRIYLAAAHIAITFSNCKKHCRLTLLYLPMMILLFFNYFLNFIYFFHFLFTFFTLLHYFLLFYMRYLTFYTLILWFFFFPLATRHGRRSTNLKCRFPRKTRFFSYFFLLSFHFLPLSNYFLLFLY